MKRYAKALADSFDVPIEPDDWHVTMLDFDETAISVHSARDRHALNKARDEIGTLLAKCLEDPLVFKPDRDRRRLERFGGFLGVPLLLTTELVHIREQAIELAGKNLRDNTVRDKWDPHISVLRHSAGKRGSKPPRQGPHAPGVLHVTGYRLEHRTFEERPKRSRRSRAPSYINRTGSTSVR